MSAFDKFFSTNLQLDTVSKNFARDGLPITTSGCPDQLIRSLKFESEKAHRGRALLVVARLGVPVTTKILIF